MTKIPALFCSTVPTVRRYLSAHSLGTYMQCGRKYEYAVVEGWEKNERNERMSFGSMGHEACEQYDRAFLEGSSHDEALKRAVKMVLILTTEYASAVVCRDCGHAEKIPDHGNYNGWCLECNSEEVDTAAKVAVPWAPVDNRVGRVQLLRAVIWYLDTIGRGDGPVRPVKFDNGEAAVELEFRVPIDLNTPDGDPFILYGKLDGLCLDGEDHYVRERKFTTSTLSSYFFRRFAPDVQISTYVLIGALMFQGFEIRGVLIDAIQTGVTLSRSARQQVKRLNSETEEWYREIKVWIRKLVVDAEAEYFPRDPANCMLYGGCDFQRICNRAPSQRAKFLAADFKKRDWDPLGENK